eukprot:2417274-Pyramimonas_sp.AAC.1
MQPSGPRRPGTRQRTPSRRSKWARPTRAQGASTGSPSSASPRPRAGSTRAGGPSPPRSAARS